MKIKKKNQIAQLKIHMGIFLFSLLTTMTSTFECHATNQYHKIIMPEPITAESDPITHVDVSKDGKKLVYALQKDQFSDLWLKPLDKAAQSLPEKITSDPGDELSPVFSNDSRFIAFTGTTYDVKGDIYLIDLDKKPYSPIRLTDRNTEDGGPCFSPDGNLLYFHQTEPKTMQKHIVYLDISSFKKSSKDNKTSIYTVTQLNGIDYAGFPAVSPDGTKIACVVYKDDPYGDIYVLDINQQISTCISRGTGIDFSPSWSPDGKYLYFSRIAYDTTHDGSLNSSDRSAIYRVPFPLSDNKSIDSFLHTLFERSSFQSKFFVTTMFYLSDMKTGSNCMMLPMEGQIPLMPTSEEQLNFANQLSEAIPYDPLTTVVAYSKVLERYQHDPLMFARITYMIGKLYQNMNLDDAAKEMFVKVNTRFKEIQPEAGLSTIWIQVLKANPYINRFQHNTVSDTKEIEISAHIVKSIMDSLQHMADEYKSITEVRERALIETARLYIHNTQRLVNYNTAITLLDQIITTSSLENPIRSEALLLKSDIYKLLGDFKAAHSICISIIGNLKPESREKRFLIDEAIERLISLYISDLEKMNPVSLNEKIFLLHQIATENKTKLPFLAIGALNRIGDLYFSNDEWAKAKSAYQEVLDNFTYISTGTAAARLALAEIYYREERFKRALELYESEIQLRPREDEIRKLARQGYIRKSIASGEYLFRLGEIASARKIFKELMDYDDQIVEAHRGYIQCANAQHDIQRVFNDYQNRMEKEPNNAVVIYATALCLTYFNHQSQLEQAKNLIVKAIAIQGQISYFYQTLGYVYEVFETVYGKPQQIEYSLEYYQKAYVLTNTESNPQNTANLLLNIGNIYYLLQQYAKAFDYYQRRENTKMPFDYPDTELLFYRRLGQSAFQVRQNSKAIEVYTAALHHIEKRIDPLAVVTAFDKLHRYLVSTMFTPAEQQETLRNKTKLLFEKKATIYAQLSEYCQAPKYPTDPEWQVYIKQIQTVVKDQTQLNQDSFELYRELYGKAGFSPSESVDDVKTTLDYLMARIDEAMHVPERLMMLFTEITDRLALAYQESEMLEQAVDFFEKAYVLNQGLGNVKNLARNKRQTAYNRYMLAQTRTGNTHRELLEKSRTDFLEVLKLIKTYGVLSQAEPKQEQGLFNIAPRVAIDEKNATEAAYGFTKDQEERLAKTFIARIDVELGNLSSAENTFQAMLQEYPKDREIDEKDLFGVGLLWHRAAHISNAQLDLKTAYERFAYATQISIALKNPVSASINLRNAAYVLSNMNDMPQDEKNIYVSQMSVLDDNVMSLFKDNTMFFSNPIIAIHHNAMGVFFLTLSPSKKDRIDDSVRQMQQIKRAVMHFSKGIAQFETQKKYFRDQLAIWALLYVNMGKASQMLNEPDVASRHYNLALPITREAKTPDIEWRALVGLNQLPEALVVLESVNMVRSGCGDQEIIESFWPLVLEKIQQDDLESAFNLMEHLSELERFHRLSEMVKPKNKEEMALYQDLYPHLLRIQEIQTQVASATPEKQAYLKQDLENEWRLYNAKENQNLPAFIQSIQDNETRHRMIMLLGLSSHAEQLADIEVNKMGFSLKKTYESLMATHHDVWTQAKSDRYNGELSEIIYFIGASSCEAIDIMESLSDNEMLVRLFPIHHNSMIGFSVTNSQLSLLTTDTLNTLELKPITYIAHEQIHQVLKQKSLPDLLLNSMATYVFNTTQLFRSIKQQKPFKHKLLSTIPLEAQKFNGFQVQSLADMEQSETKNSKFNTHTLLLFDRIAKGHSVPVKENASAFPDIFITDGQQALPRTALVELLTGLSGLTLTILPNIDSDYLYEISHVFSLFGCPSLVVGTHSSADDEFVQAFMQHYKSQSVSEALKETTNQFKTDDQWISIGYAGMGREQALTFSQNHFVEYVKRAQNAFRNQNYSEALNFFENAIAIAQADDRFAKYLPNLYSSATDSAYLLQEYHQALIYAKQLTDSFDSQSHSSKSYADALRVLGLLYSRTEQYDEAVQVLEKSLQILQNGQSQSEEANLLSTLGIVFESAMDYDQALSYFWASKDKYESATSHDETKQSVTAQQYMNIGRIYDHRMNSYAKGIENYQQAMMIYKEINDKDNIALCLLNQGRCQRLLGNLSTAEQVYEQALTYCDKEIKNQLWVKIILEQANNAWFQARYEQAFRFVHQAYETAKQNTWRELELMTLNTTGLIFWSLGNYEKAKEEFNIGLELCQNSSELEGEKATTLNNLGTVFRDMGNYSEALNYFSKALAIDQRMKSQWAVAYDLKNQGLTYLLMQKPNDAMPLFQKAVQLASDIGDRINEAKSRLCLGDAYYELKQTDMAEQAYDQALSLSKSMMLREVWWRSLFGLSRIQFDKSTSAGKDQAEKLLYEAVDVIEIMRADIKIEQLKNQFITDKMVVYEALVELLATTGKINAAFEVAERSRARGFIDLLGNQRLSLANSIDQKLYDKYMLIRSEIEEKESLKVYAIDQTSKTMYDKTIQQLNRDLESVMLEIEGQNPSLTSFVTIRPLSLEKIQEKLESGVALLAYFLLKNELCCWIIQHNSVNLVRTPINRHEMNQKILIFRRAIQNLDPIDKLSEELYQTLIQPVIHYIRDVHYLGIIPHGQLHYLSFGTLADGNEYLIDKYAFFYLPSASVLEYTLQKRIQHVAKPKVLAIGNPDLGDKGLDLPFSEQEVKTMSWNFPDITTLTREQATDRWVIDHISDFNIIHLASHGEFDSLNPLFSSIKLTKTQKSDGNLEATEVFQLNIKADMVVLSACQTGLGKITAGDDVVGLNRAFFYAGTHTVVSSLWRVSDISTAMLIKAFYRQYHNQKKADCLRLAALHVKNFYSHPGYWGAFTLVGDYF